VPDEASEERGSFWDLAGLFRQVARPFGDLPFGDLRGGFRGFEELSTWGPRTALEALLESVRSGLIGRRITTGSGDSRLSFTLSALDARLDPMATATGQADDVSLSAQDVEWSGMQFATATATLSNVHTRVGSRLSLVCAPVDLILVASDEQLDSLLAKYGAKVTASCVDAGRVRLRWRQHPTWGWIDVRPTVVGGRVTLALVAAGWDSRSRRFERQWPSKAVTTSLPDNARITGVDVESGSLVVKIRIDEWRYDYKKILDFVQS
jgi:hypothetical protein